MTSFLSDAWFDKVAELTAAAGDLNLPPALAGIVLNMVVTGTESGNVEMAINGGKLEKGLNPAATTKLTLDIPVLKKVFLEFDMNAAMQAFMSGQIKAEGDMTKLMALQTARPSAEQKALFQQVLAIA
ncbi:MAG: SCP2 sterol-binding domain-containing protein [Moraxellaceae bacterium]|nr:SCP2 sterol-binding domain-containing protein [Moraxellaceae bacterium]